MLTLLIHLLVICCVAIAVWTIFRLATDALEVPARIVKAINTIVGLIFVVFFVLEVAQFAMHRRFYIDW